jgi:hypothetical protein
LIVALLVLIVVAKSLLLLILPSILRIKTILLAICGCVVEGVLIAPCKEFIITALIIKATPIVISLKVEFRTTLITILIPGVLLPTIS